MKNTKTKVFAIVAAVVLFLGVSLYGCISPPGRADKSESETPETENNNKKTEKNAEPETTVEETTDVWGLLADLIDSIGEISDSERNKTFQGDGFALTYSGYLWEIQTMKDRKGEDISFLVYALDGTRLICSGKSTMLGYSFSKKEDVDAMHKEFYDMIAQGITGDTYFSEETKGFEKLKDGIFYANFAWRQKEDNELISAFYVIACEQENVIVSFVANLGWATKVEPSIPIMPILQSIVFESGAMYGSYEQQVRTSGDELVVAGYSFPSLSKIMDDNGISYRYAGEEKTIGKMIVPSMSNYFEEPEKVIVEIIEMTYGNIKDVYGVLDIYGNYLIETYGFYVTYPPTDYSNYGKDYRFSEMIKKLPGDDEKTIYIAIVYCQTDGVIKLQFGIVESWVSNDGIGPMNLERIAKERLD